MRVITGSAKGRRLKTLPGLEVRPTIEGVKEAIFSIVQFEIEGAIVLDMFAGSGQLGIEALSRGAKKVYFVDNSAESVKVIRDNLKHTRLEDPQGKRLILRFLIRLIIISLFGKQCRRWWKKCPRGA